MKYGNKRVLCVAISVLTWSPYFSTIQLSGSNDKTIKEWDLETGQCVLTMDLLWAMGTSNSWSDWMTEAQDQSYVGGLQFWQYALCSGTIDGAIRMWDRKSCFSIDSRSLCSSFFVTANLSQKY